MERTTIVMLGSHISKKVSISGYVDVRRNHGKLVFLDIRDRSGKVQVICLPNHPEALAEGSQLRAEWVVQIEGIVNERPEKMRTEGANGNIELEATFITVLAQAQEFPFEKDAKVNLDTYLDYLPLTLRSEKVRAIFRVQAEVANAYRGFLDKEGFTEFQAPKLIGDDAEGGANVFSVPYFNDKTAHLGTSPQFYKQIMVGVIERVYAVGNVYRAEKHSTTRHLNEYTSMDMEMGFIKDHSDLMDLELRFMHALIKQLEMNCKEEFALLGATLPTAPAEFPMMKLREALELIYKETGRDNRIEPDLEPED